MVHKLYAIQMLKTKWMLSLINGKAIAFAEQLVLFTYKKHFLYLGITKEEFHAITWFTSWVVDADHSSDCYDFTGSKFHLESIGKEECGGLAGGVEDIIRNIID
ncbi:hypothetical protein LWI28_004546 [Acer negundo]|uniref:Uncharacterized protein n=1 Tax=Acer negundo TaxID=4023 RepID=A0AAD5IY01_ACENE|nr:hypothetical protein LWI28_004546 [Acer negundo]